MFTLLLANVQRQTNVIFRGWPKEVSPGCSSFPSMGQGIKSPKLNAEKINTSCRPNWRCANVKKACIEGGMLQDYLQM